MAFMYCENITPWHKSLKAGDRAYYTGESSKRSHSVTIVEIIKDESRTFKLGAIIEMDRVVGRRPRRFGQETIGHSVKFDVGTVAWLHPLKLKVITKIIQSDTYGYDNPIYEAETPTFIRWQESK